MMMYKMDFNTNAICMSCGLVWPIEKDVNAMHYPVPREPMVKPPDASAFIGPWMGIYHMSIRRDKIKGPGLDRIFSWSEKCLYCIDWREVNEWEYCFPPSRIFTCPVCDHEIVVPFPQLDNTTKAGLVCRCGYGHHIREKILGD